MLNSDRLLLCLHHDGYFELSLSKSLTWASNDTRVKVRILKLNEKNNCKLGENNLTEELTIARGTQKNRGEEELKKRARLQQY